jgi:hypothetical protein
MQNNKFKIQKLKNNHLNQNPLKNPHLSKFHYNRIIRVKLNK